MNLEHLRKQAKNFRKLFPQFASEFGADPSLSQAQLAIARIHGFPSWEIMASAAGQEKPAMVPGTAANTISSFYFFELGPMESMSRTIGADGEPKGRVRGREAVLRAMDGRSLDHATDKLDELLDRTTSHVVELADLSVAKLKRLRDAMLALTKRYPYLVDAYAHAAGAQFLIETRADESTGATNTGGQSALEIIEPIATTLLDSVPAEGVVRVSYYFLGNRPFFRAAHAYLLALDRAGRHKEANKLAARMLKLWPNDNMGFRFLRSAADRST